MGVQIDLIVPPIIVGLLIIMIFRVNAFIMETSIDNRLNNDVQTFAEVSATVLQEEIRALNDFVDPLDHFVNDRADSVKFTNVNCVLVSIFQDERNMIIARYDHETASHDTTVYPLNLSSLEFTREPIGGPQYQFLRVKIETESRPEHHARFRNETQTVKAFEERRFLLRNRMAGVNIPCEFEEDDDDED